ncbi:MAG: ABC transporter permease [Ardenticatenaceae bacterium]|nr:ABC transporter permease [Ardenticatenaceae bacterium]MCB9443451.1 ABC transporter permease [Ardenticatenaceae bacterium]
MNNTDEHATGNKFKTHMPKRFDLKKQMPWLYILLRHPQARIGLVIITGLILMALFAPVISPGDPSTYLNALNQPPSEEHILGIDPLGRDVFALTVWGARITLTIGFGTAALAILIATTVGLIAGYFRGIVDDLLVLLMNLFLVVPGLPLLIVLSAYLRASTATVIFALALTGWAFHARIIRSMTLSLREKDYVAASIVAGESNFVIIFRQILPNLINLIVGGFIGTSIYGIAASTALSYLGLVKMTDISWGTNLFYAQNGNALLLGAWWVFIPSGFLVALSALGLAWINFGMDEITNPRLRSERELRKVLRKTKMRQTRVTPFVPRKY